MARPCKKFLVTTLPKFTAFATVANIAQDIPQINISVEEFETLRLIDYSGKTQEECAQHMAVSRGSVQALYSAARKKLARFMIEGNQLVIAGGNYQLKANYREQGEQNMKLALTYENGQIFQHFGQTKTFKIYEIEANKVVASKLLDAGSSGHGALINLLQEEGIDVLICGGIGAGAKNFLAEAGIDLYAGAIGEADSQVASFLDGKLHYNPNARCSHRSGEGSHGHHGCHGHHHEHTGEHHDCHGHHHEHGNGGHHGCHRQKN